jgi:hypothetical protein
MQKESGSAKAAAEGKRLCATSDAVVKSLINNQLFVLT